MARQEKKPKDKWAIDWLETYKKVRKDWGVTDPRTKIKQSKKKYNRRKEKLKWKKELDDSV